MPSPVVSESLSFYLYEIKERIQEYEQDWDQFKKYTNPYEYIHSNLPNRRKSVSKYKPLSRSFFKMVEIINTFNLIPPVPSPCLFPATTPTGIRTFHLAEGPGGFIEAVAKLRNCPIDCYVGMTIQCGGVNEDVPGWKKSARFLRENPNVYIENGADGTGDILQLANFAGCYEKYASSMDLITADGGFDFSLDFNHQEVHIARLLFAQIAYALVMQRRGGNFVLKIFDSFMGHTIDLIYLLSSMYEKVYISKPLTSRFANSEKYIVCQGFLHDTCPEIYATLHTAFFYMTTLTNTQFVCRFLRCIIPQHFMNRIEECNASLGQQQVETIQQTIALMNSYKNRDRLEQLLRTNIQKCIDWCTRHKVEYNRDLT
jgi:23S rRNA U2552 (ribose-2'-O)-methylase RlmE/FtsJ